MPKINSPADVAEYVPNLPHRLRDLRLEMGWSLDDLVPIVGVTQKGVISNWEATNQRRRTPPITTMVILARWYGVSLDYLIGNPKADKESPAVKAGKAILREKLKAVEGLEKVPPSDRARLALKTAAVVEPEAFFLDRAAACLLQNRASLDQMMQENGQWPDAVLRRLADFLGLPSDWFYSFEPVTVLDPTK